MIKLTIITITYNSEKTLEKTIHSVLNQKYDNLEYIIIDGYSSDGTVEIIRRYETSLAYWISEPDNGISDAFNKGLRIANGDIVGIINSDDLFSNNIFYKITSEFENRNIDYLYGDLVIKNENNNLKVMKSTFKNTFPYGGMPFGHPTLFIKKSVYNRIGYFNTNYKVAMDFELFLRLFQYFKGYYLRENIAIHSRGGVSDINFILGHKEVLKASLASAASSNIVAIIKFIYRILRTAIRKVLEFLNR